MTVESVRAHRAKQRELLQGLKVGYSIFIRHRDPDELTYLRQMAYAVNIKVSFRKVSNDPIHLTWGTRVMRVA